MIRRLIMSHKTSPQAWLSIVAEMFGEILNLTRMMFQFRKIWVARNLQKNFDMYKILDYKIEISLYRIFSYFLIQFLNGIEQIYRRKANGRMISAWNLGLRTFLFAGRFTRPNRTYRVQRREA